MPGFIESKCVEIAASSILLLKLEAFRDLDTILFLPVGVVFAHSQRLQMHWVLCPPI